MKRLTMLVALALAACGGSDDSDGHAASAPSSADTAVPAETMTDWVTYAEQVAVFTVVSERQVAANAHEVGPGLDADASAEWRVTVRIDEVIWSAPGTTPTSGEFEFVVGPWAWHDDAEAFARYDVGGQYLAPLTDFGWGYGPMILQAAEIVDMQGGPIADVADPLAAVLRQIDRDAVADIAGQLAATAPDPAAAPYMDLPPVERWQATSAAEYEAEGGCERVGDC